ncbi:hypothetical protein [Neptuniibacter sp.]|uniref:hypothetical protein n=1 Tax=Neptuniibacter sp. TaxID=1962643 RepID=UPI003B5B5E76
MDKFPEWLLETAKELGADMNNSDDIAWKAYQDFNRQCGIDEARDKKILKTLVKKTTDENEVLEQKLSRFYEKGADAATKVAPAHQRELMNAQALKGKPYKAALEIVKKECAAICKKHNIAPTLSEKTIRNNCPAEWYKRQLVHYASEQPSFQFNLHRALK